METIKVNCDECSIEFEKNLSEYNRKKKLGKNTFFCSLSCGTKFQVKQQIKKRETDYLLNPKLCLQCKEILPYKSHLKNKFCNSSCSAKYNNKDKIIVKKCLFCNVDFNPYKGNKGKFCSNKCKVDFRNKQMELLILSGEFKTKGGYPSNTFRKHLIRIRGNKCEDCKLEYWKNQQIPLTVHHIDGDANNNNMKNVQLLCWNCHSITDNYGSKNLKSTRIYRYAL